MKGIEVNDDHLIVGKKYYFLPLLNIINPTILIFDGIIDGHLHFHLINGNLRWFQYNRGEECRKWWVVVNVFKFGRKWKL